MRKERLILTTLVFYIAGLISAQELPLQSEFENAVRNQTRTMKGVPGPAYWINHSDYILEADIIIDNDTVWIEGKANIRYYNESPDSLRMIVLRSYPDVMADAAIRNYYIFPQNETPQVQYSDLVVNKEDTVPSEMLMGRRTSTNLMVSLRKPLAPGKDINMELSWKYFLHPQINIRQGHYANDAIFVAYWYPQVAVYDDIYGWDMTDYAGIVEFYNDFNNYDVSVTLPAGYMVWAGGVLQNPGEVYPESLRKKIDDALGSDEIVKNTGGLPLPVYLELEYSDGSKKKIHRKPEVFRSDLEVLIDIEDASNLKSVKLGNPYFFDRDASNNEWIKEG